MKLQRHLSIVICIFVLLIISAGSFSQEKPSIKAPSFFVIAKDQKDRILLSWAVDQPSIGTVANKYGLLWKVILCLVTAMHTLV